MLGSYKGIKLGYTILGDVDGITFGIDVGIYLGRWDGSFDGSNDCKIGSLFLGVSLGSDDGKVLHYDEAIKPVLFDS